MTEPRTSIRREDLRLSARATAALVTLDNPRRLNAIDGGMIAQLDAALDGIAADRAVRAVLVTGAGRAFSSGGDLKRYVALQRDPVAFPAFVEDLHRVFGRLRQLDVPVIALVNGVTAAGGLELMLSCDLSIAARSATVMDGHLNFGQMGGGGVLTLLPRVVGIQRAAELVFSGRALSGDELVDWGIVNRVVPDDELLDAGTALAGEIAAKSPLAVANAKRVMNAVWSDAGSLEAGLRFERERNAFYCLTAFDAREGLAAFSERRRPRFRGR
jgi:enoyl-CoA hydratase